MKARIAFQLTKSKRSFFNMISNVQGMMGYDPESDAISVASQRQFDYHSIERKVLGPYAKILKLVGTVF